MANYNINSSVDSDSGITEIVAGGQLVVLNSKAIKKDMAKISVKTNQIHFVLDNVDDIDLSFIQLLKSFEQLKAKEGILLRYTFNLSNELQLLLTQTGVLTTFNK